MTSKEFFRFAYVALFSGCLLFSAVYGFYLIATVFAFLVWAILAAE